MVIFLWWQLVSTAAPNCFLLLYFVLFVIREELPRRSQVHWTTISGVQKSGWPPDNSTELGFSPSIFQVWWSCNMTFSHKTKQFPNIGTKIQTSIRIGWKILEIILSTSVPCRNPLLKHLQLTAIQPLSEQLLPRCWWWWWAYSDVTVARRPHAIAE